jgi:hypothetical protein
MSTLTVDFVQEDLYYFAKTNSPKNEYWVNPRTGKKMNWTPDMERWYKNYLEQISYFNLVCR